MDLNNASAISLGIWGSSGTAPASIMVRSSHDFH
jgi:hypothetical protein